MKPAVALAALPLQTIGDMAALPRLQAERAVLVEQLQRGCQRSGRGLLRRRRLAQITSDILAREARLAGMGIDPAGYDAPVRSHCETEH